MGRRRPRVKVRAGCSHRPCLAGRAQAWSLVASMAPPSPCRLSRPVAMDARLFAFVCPRRAGTHSRAALATWGRPYDLVDGREGPARQDLTLSFITQLK